MSLRPRAAAAPVPAAAPQSDRLRFVLSTNSKFSQPPSTDAKRKNKDIRDATIKMSKRHTPAELMMEAWDNYAWVVNEVEELNMEERSGEPSYGREDAYEIYGASVTEMRDWFQRMKIAIEEIKVRGPGTDKDEDNGENTRRLMGKGGEQLRRLIQAKWMESGDGFRYERDKAELLSFPKASKADEVKFYAWLADDRKSLNEPIVNAMGIHSMRMR